MLTPPWRGVFLDWAFCNKTGIDNLAFWEQILLGIGAVALVVLFWPGARVAMQKSREAENPDWKGALLPVAAVIGFVILLIMVASA